MENFFLPAVGWRRDISGELHEQASYGLYWSSSSSSGRGIGLGFDGATLSNTVWTPNNPYGVSIRCVR